MNHPDAWSDAEMALLLEKRAEGMLLREIGALLGRSARACGSQYRLLTRPLPSGVQPVDLFANHRPWRIEHWTDYWRQQWLETGSSSDSSSCSG